MDPLCCICVCTRLWRGAQGPGVSNYTHKIYLTMYLSFKVVTLYQEEHLDSQENCVSSFKHAELYH